ncbi:MAG: DUF721 domain-containing protein [Candidatus Riflebacteria bacterium]|nr:DUF721 domain-containing protein [Candidatus Riflebacteria bacterium]
MQNKIFPISELLTETINEIIIESHKSDFGSFRNNVYPQFFLNGKDLVRLGKLKYNWKKIVGDETAKNAIPTRISGKRLFLSCSNSQWLHTLIFLKENIVQKVKNQLGFELNEIKGEVGQIKDFISKNEKHCFEPPSWEKEEPPSIPSEVPQEMKKKIQIIAQKLDARKKWFELNGFHLCEKCQANLIQSSSNICAVCSSQNRENLLIQARSILLETPWISFFQTSQILPELGISDWRNIRNELYNECLKIADEYAISVAKQLENDQEIDHEEMENFKAEVIKTIILSHEEIPIKIDLNDLTSIPYLPERNWWFLINYSKNPG